MTDFKDRERGEEAKFAFDEETPSRSPRAATVWSVNGLQA